MSTNDPLRNAFDVLKARSGERAAFNPELEERMMKEFGNGNRQKAALGTKIAAAIALCVLVTGAAAATAGIDTMMDWATLTGFFESPDGSSGYVENGRVISGEMNFQGKMHRVENGHMLDEDGNVIGSVHMESTPCSDECAGEACSSDE